MAKQSTLLKVVNRAFIEPGSFIMERKMMLGVKERAEAAVAQMNRDG